MRRYLVTMGVRVACCALAIVASGWLRWTFVVGAVLLPYIAVVLANAVGPRQGTDVTPIGDPQDARRISSTPTDVGEPTLHGRLVD